MLKAAVLYGKKNIKIEEVNLPPSQDSTMIRVAACGICISDVKAYQEGQSHYCKPPIILGHEYILLLPPRKMIILKREIE